MKTAGNVLWFICGGLFSGLSWLLVGLLWCISIVGIPVGLQCFKFASVSFWPFGKEVVYSGGAVSFLVNVLWFLFGGFVMGLENFCFGLLCCITVIGIPFGLQYFKLAKLSLAPFGATIEKA